MNAKQQHFNLQMCKCVPFRLLISLFIITATHGFAQQQEVPKDGVGLPTGRKAQAHSMTEPKEFSRHIPDLLPQIPLSSTNGLTGIVSTQLVYAAVRQRADARWDRYAIGIAIPCADASGMLVCYQVPVALETDSFPDTLAPPPASEIAFLDLQSPRLWGVGSFWTFVVSAREVDYPIFHHYQGLPPILVTFEKAKEIAREHIPDPTLIRYTSMGHAGTHYVFRGSDDSSFTIDAYTMRQTPDRSTAPKQGTAVQEDSTPEQEEAATRFRSQVDAAWEAIRSHAAQMGEDR